MRRSLRRARGNARPTSLRAVMLRASAIARGCVSARTSLMAGLCVSIALAGCAKEKKAQGGPPPVPVVAQFAERMDVPIEIHAVGTVEPMNSVSVQSLVQGEITRVGFREGEDVRKGDVLFVIDPRPYQAALEQSRANLARDAAQAASAASNAARYEELVAKDYVTRQQADDARAAAEAARAVLRADSAAVERAKLDFQNCTIRAPISGRTGSVLLQAGNIVRPGAATPLVVINQIAPIQVSFAVPEQRLPEIRRGQAMNWLTVEAGAANGNGDRAGTGAGASAGVGPGAGAGSAGTGADAEAMRTGAPAMMARGELTFVNNAIDEQTGTVQLKATFPNEDHALWPGQFVDVKLGLGVEANAVVVPSTAIQPGQEGSYVFVIGSDRTAQMQRVVPGERTDGRTIVRAGLAGDEQVVTEGHLRLVPGAKVDIRSPGQATAGPNGAATGSGANASGAPNASGVSGAGGGPGAGDGAGQGGQRP